MFKQFTLPNIDTHGVFTNYDAQSHMEITQIKRNRQRGLDLKNCQLQEIEITGLDCVDKLPPRFRFKYHGFEFNFYFAHKPVASKLYVIFSGARQAHENYALFKRHSWNHYFDGNALYVADPTFSLYPNLLLGWYLGTPEIDLYPLLSKIIQKVATATGSGKILSYGSSGGGFAALKIAEYLPVTAIAINPQIFLREYSYWQTFRDVTGFDKSPEYAQRCRPYISPLSQYLVVQNDCDLEHVQNHLYPLLKMQGILPKFGFTGHRNFYSWIYHAYGGHNSQEDKNLLGFIPYLAGKLPLRDARELDELDNLAISISECWSLHTWQRYLLTSSANTFLDP